MRLDFFAGVALLVGQIAFAQAVLQASPHQEAAGSVIFSREKTPDEGSQGVSSSSETASPGVPDSLPKTAVTDSERTSVRIDSYDLDMHLIPAEAREEVHATLSLRNISGSPISRFPLQISSTLRWQTIKVAGSGGLKGVGFTQSPIATDADHTGYAQEAVVTPDRPIAPGATLTLSVFYLGEIRQTAARLELLGTPTDRAQQADWDAIESTSDDRGTAMRGFGDVLWYPVAEPTAVLGDGNKLFELIASERVEGAASTVRLRLTVEYVGEPPVGAIFDGEVQTMATTADDQNQLVAETHGVATVEFPVRQVGFRIPSLFLTAEQPVVTDGQLLSVLTARSELVAPYAEAAAKVQPLLSEWLGSTPIQPLVLLDHPGSPFEDHALLVGQLAIDARPDDIAPELVSGLSYAWFRSSHPWISEGLAHFMSLLWIERTRGRDAAVAALAHEVNLLALAEPDISGSEGKGVVGQALLQATSDVYLRSKAAAVFWQLRDILGEDVLKKGIAAYRRSEMLNASFDADPKAMQETLERVSNKDLNWFFEDWVYHDRALPDLSIVQASPHPLPARAGRSSGYVVAVEVRNDGGAAAEVPVTVRSGQLTATERLRIPGHGTASTRVLLEDLPDTVQVNDGDTPELRATIHTRTIEGAPPSPLK